MKTTPKNPSQSKPRIYILHPFPPVAPVLPVRPGADPVIDAIVAGIVPAAPAARPAFPFVGPSAPARPVPPRQPLPTAVIDPAKPLLKLGLDVHLAFLMAVAQKDHANPQAPRKFTNDQLVEQVQKWIAEGLQVCCVQESCGFGFVLHRRLVEAGAQSFLITPIALNGARKTDKLDARALGLRLSRWLDGNRDELAPIRIPSEAEQRRREVTRRRQFLAREIRALANHGHGQVAEHCHEQLPHHWWGPRNWKKLAALDPWVLGLLTELRTLILALEEKVRALLAEAVWRFLRWQPGWSAAQRMKVKLADGTSMRKKTVVALARLLAIDLWRWRTGRATMAELGWVAA